MEEGQSFTDEQCSVHRGVLHVWSGACSESLAPERVLLSRPVLQVSLGACHALLLAEGGLVFSVGELPWRTGLAVPLSQPLLEHSLNDVTVVLVSAGSFHCGALTEEGAVYMWGENSAGQCGALGTEGSDRVVTGPKRVAPHLVSEPQLLSVVDRERVPPARVRVRALACGGEHTLALSAQHEVWSWGSGYQLGLVTSTFPVWRPQKVEHLSGRHVIQVACGSSHSLALVRSQPPKDYTTQASSSSSGSRCGQCQKTDQEDSVVMNDSHYCPLGVELVQAGGSPRSGRTRPSRGPVLLQESGDSVPSLDNEVWSWGRGQEGQLGHGDRLPRLQPLCIKSLTGQEVVGLATGTHHSLAVTAQCQVFSWGSNISGQLGRLNSPTTQPQQAKVGEGVRVWGVSGGLGHSLFLADGDHLQPVLWHCGPKVTQGSEVNHAQGSANRKDAFRAVVLPLSVELGYVSEVCGGGQGWAALSDHNIMGFISALHQLAANERRVYCWVSDVRKKVLRPLLNRESVCSLLGQTCRRLFETLAESFTRLSLLIGQHSVSLTNFLRRTQHRDVTSLFLLTHTSLFLDTYKEYCSSIGNFQVMGGFQNLQKLSLECFGKKQEVLLTLSAPSGPDRQAVPDLLLSLFHQPLHSLPQYSTLLLRLATCYDVSTREYQLLQQGCAQYDALSLGLSRRRKEAEATWLFWKTSSGKSVDPLRSPERRVVCESSNRTLTLQNAGRFSNVWFLLFNDALVQAQLSGYQTFPLATLWVRPVTEDDSGLHAIKVTLPEQSFILTASSAEEKARWLRALNLAVEQVLEGGQGSGVPAVSRSASYTFRVEGRLKDARYSGGWVAGKPHGRGTMKWADGRTYVGTFRNGLEDGYGDCVIPTKVLNQPDRYLGNWREAKIHGFGIYRYASGEVYEGCFHEGQRHGYGMLCSGRLGKSSSSVFIGQWVQDRKTGYGVFDDITKGEKYMGAWLEDQRQGLAVVVTQFGLYYQGAFSSNKMTGAGILVSDDDTSFQGEFSDDWTINGKGTLVMPNGDHIEGQFSGQWSSGLKIVGTYTKPSVEEPDGRPRALTLAVRGLAVQVEQKWRCVFEECWSRLGCDALGQGDRRRAWENIAVILTSGRRDSPKLSHSQSKILERLEFIPQEVGPMTTSSYHELRRYLTKACETPLHPLGWLLETLVTVYRMTYACETPLHPLGWLLETLVTVYRMTYACETPLHPLGWLLETLVTVYRMTYVGVGCNRRLLPQAVQEIHSYLTHTFSILRFLFPGLPEEGGFIPNTRPTSDLSVDTSSGTHQDSSNHGYVVSSSSLLLPVLLPPLYPPLFTLYALEKEKEERLYWECVLRLNKQTDQALLSFLGVQQKFWPVTISVLGEMKRVESSTRDLCYSSSVETLQQISTTFTPSDKLLVIQRTFRELSQEVQVAMEGMDDLLPPFLYVVIRARIRNLGAEVSLIEDLMDSSVQLGELGFLFTTLKGSYYQIQQETA
ncbi:alsin-like [Aplochiton taeniatus]